MSAPIPAPLQHRPTWGALPVPYTVYWVDGKPDFRVTDVDAWLQCARRRCCALCGRSLASKIFFIGGPASIENRLFSDMAMHRECAYYAAAVCPYIAAGRDHAARATPAGTIDHALVSPTRPDRLYLVSCYGYDLVGSAQDMAMGLTPIQVRAHPFKTCQVIGATALPLPLAVQP